VFCCFRWDFADGQLRLDGRLHSSDHHPVRKSDSRLFSFGETHSGLQLDLDALLLQAAVTVRQTMAMFRNNITD
jgi:hypothetical protein